MVEPTITIGEWLAAAVATILSALAGTFGGMRYGKSQMLIQIGDLRDDMNNHVTQLAVLKTCQSNTEERLDEIKETIVDTNNKVTQLNQNLTQILISLSKNNHDS